MPTPVKNISYENLSTFAAQMKAKYAKAADLASTTSRIKALEDAGVQANVLEGVKVNGTALAIAEKMVDILFTTGTTNGTVKMNGVDVSVAGLAAMAYKANVSQADLDEALAAVITAKANSADVYTKAEVDGKISSVYKPGGSVTFANLPTADEAHLGLVYNVTNGFTTTDGFLEGAGKKHTAGTNVVVVKSGEEYKYDVLSGFVDLSEYAKTADVVAKEEGKGLSTNDYTNDDKAKLGGIAEGATKVEASETNGNIKVNGSETPVYVLPDTVLHQSDFETVTEAEILALFEETVAE